MLVAKQFTNSFLSFGSLIEAVRTRLKAPVQDVDSAAQPRGAASTPDAIDNTDKMDQARYARLLDHELDRQLLTEVEREDTDMLNRVRSALYDD